ncbi:MAG: hypothetical protein AAF960_04325 [Bacteroidota bacterium]
MAITAKRKTWQLFEHQTIRVGSSINGILFDEKTFHTLAIYQEKQTTKYFTLVYRGIKLSHYVGIIQVGDLTIEILPKADRSANQNAAKWQGVLLEMLRYCRLLPIESAGLGQVRLASNTILDLYVRRFLESVQSLINKGLPRKYLGQKSNEKVLKGRLDLPTHLRKNGHRSERFWVQYQSFAYDHLFNQMLLAALKTLDRLYLKSDLKWLVKQALATFPVVSDRWLSPSDFERLFQNSLYQEHRFLMEWSRLILLNFSPDIRYGQHHLFALLFDMNQLYEEYVFWQLKRLENERITVRRQTSRPFWQRRTIRPDLVVQVDDTIFVLDTKWKLLSSNPRTGKQPPIEDLKQLYIYCQYFSASKGILLYPKVSDAQKNTSPIPFQSFDSGENKVKGQVLFLPILKEDGMLNRRLGAEIFERLV